MHISFFGFQFKISFILQRHFFGFGWFGLGGWVCQVTPPPPPPFPWLSKPLARPEPAPSLCLFAYSNALQLDDNTYDTHGTMEERFLEGLRMIERTQFSISGPGQSNLPGVLPLCLTQPPAWSDHTSSPIWATAYLHPYAHRLGPAKRKVGSEPLVATRIVNSPNQHHPSPALTNIVLYSSSHPSSALDASINHQQPPPTNSIPRLVCCGSEVHAGGCCRLVWGAPYGRCS